MEESLCTLDRNAVIGHSPWQRSDDEKFDASETILDTDGIRWHRLVAKPQDRLVSSTDQYTRHTVLNVVSPIAFSLSCGGRCISALESPSCAMLPGLSPCGGMIR